MYESQNTELNREILQTEYNQKLCEESTEGHLFELIFDTFNYGRYLCIKCYKEKPMINGTATNSLIFTYGTSNTIETNFNKEYLCNFG